MTDDALSDLLFRVMTGRSPWFTLSSAMEGKRVERWLEQDRLAAAMIAPVKAIMADPVCFCWAGAAYDALNRIAEEGEPPVVVTAQMAGALLAMSYDQDFQQEAGKSAGYGSYTIPDRCFWEGDPNDIPPDAQ